MAKNQLIMELNQIHQAILENMSGEVYVRDLDMNLLYINPAAERLTGWTCDESLGKKCYEVFGDEDLKCKVACPVEKAISQRLPILHHEGKLKTRSGDVRDMQVSISPFYDKENLIGAIVVMADTSRLREVEQTNVKTLIALEKENDERKLAEEALMESQKRLHILSSQLIAAQEEERRRISLELHDEMGQALTAVELNLMEMEKELPSDFAPIIREKLDETRSIVDQASDQIRELSLFLRPSMLDDLGLVPTVRWHLNRFRTRTNVKVKFEAIYLDERLDQDTDTVLYRVIQEALNNVAKHAGAKKVMVSLQRKENAIAAYIEDDGKGFDVNEALGKEAPVAGIGLIGMQERVALLDGSLTIESQKGHGTRISLEVPVH